MSQFKFEFEKTYKEIDVAGKIYRVNFDDDALTRYQKSIKRFDKGIKELNGLIETDVEKATDEQIEAAHEKQKAVVKDVVETFLGTDTFDELYEKAWRSVANLMDLVYYLMDIYNEENKTKVEQARSKYLANTKR